MKSSKVLLFISVVVVLLAGLCVIFPTDGIRIRSLTLRFPSLHQVLVREKAVDIDDLLRQQEQNRELLGLRDSVDYYRELFASDGCAFQFPDNDPTYFDSLFAQLERTQAEGRTRRILHYGDSQIEMDRMTMQLRDFFQSTFGGGGVGMLPIRASVGSRSVSQHASGSLSHQSSFLVDSLTHSANGNYGPMAHCWHLAGGATGGVNASKDKKVPEQFKHFSRVTLLFNNLQGPLSASVNAAGYSKQLTCGDLGVHSLSWKLDSAVSSINFTLQGGADVYAILVDDGPGVAVDNIALRGCSGQQFTMINEIQLAAAYAEMDIAMIILQFGGNSVPYLQPGKGLNTYCSSLEKQIARLRKCCPDAMLLFVGPSDMSTTVNGQIQSYPAMQVIVDSLRNMALRNGVAYWSIYDAMGGKNTMKAWVDNGLANTDYIHFSTKGVDIMGGRFAEAFARMYEFYKLRKQLTSTQFDSIWNNKYQFDSIRLAHDSISQTIENHSKKGK